MIILDTDHISHLQEGSREGQRIRARLEALGLAEFPPTTIITFEEQMRGWIGKLGQAKRMADQLFVYRRLARTLNYFAALTVYEFDERSATEFQRFRSLKIRIGTMDLKIAAVAVANGATLWTRNRRDFEHVPGLHFEDGTL